MDNNNLLGGNLFAPAGSAPRAAVFRAAPRLGRRLAADLELVRTRGIRLFN